jgi:hypothetical protein
VSLAAKLQAHAAGRPADAPLLVKANGSRWQKSDHQYPFAQAVRAVGLDPCVVTIYALRHSSITRQLLSGVPIRLTASLHDTSTRMIERNYSRYITDHADTIVRRALVDLAIPADANVVPLHGERDHG